MSEESSSEQPRRPAPDRPAEPDIPTIRIQILQKDYRPDSATATTSIGIIRKVLRDDEK